MIRRLSAPIAVVVAVAAVAGCSTQTEPPSGTPVAVSSSDSPVPAARTQAARPDPRFLADDLPMLPFGVDRAVRPVELVRATYEFAARHPEVLDYVPCFCGCERGGHKGNHDCFVSGRDASGKVTGWEAHALGCEVCLDVARDAMQMHNGGASVSQIRQAIDAKYSRPGGLSTPTPMPPKGGHQH
jgi:hypothetical protein